MTLKLKGKKLGMTTLFDKNGHIKVCTVIEVEPNVVVQIKTIEKDGYSAIQTGYGKVKAKKPETAERRISKPLRGHFKKVKVEPRRYLSETRMKNLEKYATGQEFGVEIFKDTIYVDATARSIGKGYQGAMKLHNFAGGPAAHGAKKVHRSLGSTGNRSTPGRCFPGGKRASHMGFNRVTVESLEIVEIIEEENLILIKGAVPGPRNGIVTLRQAMKKTGAE